jgi:glycine/D-amino acid oxidase-like deaminating enzyme
MTTLTADVAVVGGGLIGAWSAFFLARRGQRVVLLEKGIVGAQSSGTNFGNLRLQGRFPGQYPLSLRSQALWERLPELIGEDCEFAPTGHLYCAFDEKESTKLEHYAGVSESHGLAIDRLDAAALRRCYPLARPQGRRRHLFGKRCDRQSAARHGGRGTCGPTARRHDHRELPRRRTAPARRRLPARGRQ